MNDNETDRFELTMVLELKATGTYDLRWIVDTIQDELENGERIVSFEFNEHQIN